MLTPGSASSVQGGSVVGPQASMVRLQDTRAVSSEGGGKGSGALGHGKGSRKASRWRCPGWAPKRARAEAQPGQRRGAQSQRCSTPARVPSAW